MLQPTSGECEIQGHHVLQDAAAARRSLGICPQQNVLFGSLTVEEHLLLYASIKGIPGEGLSSRAYAPNLKTSDRKNPSVRRGACECST